jgi:ATP-dependent protease ClpP protease subunit
MPLKPLSRSLIAVLICFIVFAQAKAQDIDVRSAYDLLIRQFQEDFARQRARARIREDAEDAAEAQRNLPADFSQFSTPVEAAPPVVTAPPIYAARSIPTGVSGEISCSLRSVGITIDINGEIDNATVESVSKFFDQYHEQQRKVASGLICRDSAAEPGPPDFSAQSQHFGINSRGGSITAAMAIGRMLRKEHAHLFVDDSSVCISSCVLVLAGAVDRQISASAVIGIHRPYYVTSAGQTLSSEKVRSTYDTMLKDIRAYFREMDVSRRLADDLLATEPENVHILTHEEINKYGLGRLDSVEQQRRAIAKEVSDLQESSQLGLDRLEYTRRKALGDRLCSYTAASDYSEVSDCKKRVLTTGRR